MEQNGVHWLRGCCCGSLSCNLLVVTEGDDAFSSAGEGEGSETTVVVESPPLQRVKALSEASETSDTGSFTSQGWEDTGEAVQREPGGICYEGVPEVRSRCFSHCCPHGWILKWILVMQIDSFNIFFYPLWICIWSSKRKCMWRETPLVIQSIKKGECESLFCLFWRHFFHCWCLVCLVTVPVKSRHVQLLSFKGKVTPESQKGILGSKPFALNTW